MTNYIRKKNELVMDILNHFHYIRWEEQTHKRVDEIPPKLQQIYYRFGTLVVFPASSSREEKKQIDELKQIRKKLKKIYKGEKT